MTKEEFGKTEYTDWANEPNIELLKNDLTHAREYARTQREKIKRWKDAYDANNHVKRKDRSNVQPKMIRTAAEWRYPSLSEPFLSSNKLFQVTPLDKMS